MIRITSFSSGCLVLARYIKQMLHAQAREFIKALELWCLPT